MTYKFELEGVPARLPVAEVIELLARQEAASEATACSEQPVFEQGAVGLDIADESRQYRHSLDVRVLAAERQWSSLIAHSVTSGALVICNRQGRPVAHLGIEEGFLSVAAVAQWLANAGVSVQLDGVQVVKAQSASAEPEILKRKVLKQRYESMWPTIGANLQEASRNGLMAEAGYGLSRGYFDVEKALRWAARRGFLIGEWAPQFQSPLADLPGQDDDRKPTPLNDLPSWPTPLKRRSSKEDDWLTNPDPDAYYKNL